MLSGVVFTIAESGWTSSIGDSHEGTGYCEVATAASTACIRLTTIQSAALITVAFNPAANGYLTPR